MIGFDGSQMNGRAQIASEIGAIFADRTTVAYVRKVQEVRWLSPTMAVVPAIIGMIPPGHQELHPDANAVQTVVAVKSDDRWRIAVFQNTPAQFHGRPELVQAMTEELRQLL